MSSTRHQQAWLLPADTREGELRQGVSLRSVVAVLRRRRKLFLAPAIALAAIGIALALVLPARYRAEAVLAVEAGITRGAQDPVAPDLDSEMQLARIYEVVHRRGLLETLGREFDGLAGEKGRPMTEQELTELRSRVRAELEGPRTFSLAFDDASPERAKDVVARIVELLVTTSHAERERKAKATAGFVQEQLAQLSSRIREQERAIEQYKRSAYDQLPEQMPTLLGQMKSVDDQIQETAASTAELESKRAAIRRQIAELEQFGYSKDPAQAGADKLRMELARLRQRYTEEHPEVMRARAELAEMERAIAEQRVAVSAPEMTPSRLRMLQLTGELQDVEARLARTTMRRDSLAAQAAGYRGRLAEAPRHEMAIAAMAREYEADKAQYQALLDELHDARLTERIEEATQGVFRVVEAPRIPTEPFSPRRVRIALLGILAGLGVGLAAAFLAEQADTSIQTVEELDMASTLPVLASIPTFAPVKETPALLAVNPRAARGVSLLDDPYGAVSEQYRILATKLIRGVENGNGHRHGLAGDSTAMLITSAGAGEGKTTAAVNIALALARMMPDEAVLLVDADLGRPAVHRMLDLPQGPGLAELLTRPDDEPGKYIKAMHGMFVLPAGEYAFEARSVWSSPLARRVLESLRRRFRYVVVDSPPILAVAEGLILQDVVDSVLLVVRARVTPRELIRRSLASLDLSRLAGVVLTDVQGLHEAYTYPYFDPANRPARAGGASSW